MVISRPEDMHLAITRDMTTGGMMTGDMKVEDMITEEMIGIDIQESIVKTIRTERIGNTNKAAFY